MLHSLLNKEVTTYKELRQGLLAFQWERPNLRSCRLDSLLSKEASPLALLELPHLAHSWENLIQDRLLLALRLESLHLAFQACYLLEARRVRLHRRVLPRRPVFRWKRPNLRSCQLHRPLNKETKRIILLAPRHLAFRLHNRESLSQGHLFSAARLLFLRITRLSEASL